MVRRFLIYVAVPLLLGAPGVLISASAADAASTQAETVTATISDIKTVTLAHPADEVAAYWRGSTNAHVTLAFSTDGVTFGAPVDAGRDDSGGESRDGTTYGEVQVADGAIAVRVTTDVPLPSLTVVGISPGDYLRFRSASVQMPFVEEDEQAGVITRAGWGADPRYMTWAPEFYPVYKVIVHHTGENIDVNGTQEYYAKLVRAIYYYHAVTRGWGDIAYNFLIDPLGNIYEGRYSGATASPFGEDIYGNGVIGGHTYSHNAGTVGVAVLGNYANRSVSLAARASLEKLLAWEATRNGIDPVGSGLYRNPFNATPTIQTFNIAGHRDYTSTDCPGNAFYNDLPAIRQDVLALTGPVTPPSQSRTYITLATSASTPTIGQKVTISATLLEQSSQEPLAGETLSFASGGIATEWSPLGSAVTDANGVASLETTFATVQAQWISASFDPGPDPANRGSTTTSEVDVALAGLTAVPGDAQVQLSWNADVAASGYNVYRDGVKVNSVPVPSAAYTDSGLVGDVLYCYQVTAVVNGRESAKSETVEAIPSIPFFPDVAINYPYRQAIRELSGAGIVCGKTDGKFYPSDPVSRQQFAKMIALGGDYPVSESDVCLFKDVAKSGAATLYPDNYVAACAARGITLGKTPTTFDPYANITRAQVLTMVVRAAQDFKPSALGEPPAGWKGVLPASDPVHGANIARAEYSGLLSGIDLATFSVSGNASRGEIAQIIWNIREK